MQIDIDIPRPGLTVITALAVIAGTMWLSGTGLGIGGGANPATAAVVKQAEGAMRDLRLEQRVLLQREEILRAEVAALEREEERTRDPMILLELKDSRERLLALLQNKRAAEAEILAALRQLQDAQGVALQASLRAEGGSMPVFSWPVEPQLGLSAFFGDDAYEARFGIPHRAIDIPVDQGTVVAAAADGTVVQANDNGLGFNSVVLRHAGGYATLYGHVSAFLVVEGQTVRAGDPIALSGGRPGTPGAGRLTTGAHLHLELLKNGVQVDPLLLLPGTAQ